MVSTYFDIEVEIKKGRGLDNIHDTDERREHCSQMSEVIDVQPSHAIKSF